MALYRNNDQGFERLLSRSSSQRKIAVSLSLYPTARGFALSGEGVSVSIVCEHQKAEKPQRENILRQLSRLGGTIYECSEITLPDDFNYFIPSSLLVDMRRNWVDAMRQKKQPKKQLPVFCQYSGPSMTTDPNISNQQASRFYGVSKSTAYELRPDNRPLMQCRHCLRFSLGYCVKHGGKKPTWREPLFLRLGDGRRFRLEFNCQQCQMNVYAAD
jgi:putative protease